jgi:hypothetical protein
MMRIILSISFAIFLTGCAGKTAHDTVSPVGRPIGTVLATTQAPIQGATESYAVQSARTQENPYGR